MQVIDHRYEVVRRLGTGGMGVVYLARDRGHDGRLVAVKTIANARAARTFEREFRLLARLSHPHLAAVFDFGFDTTLQSHYFTSEYIDGGPLAWSGTGRPFDWLFDRAVELCRALAYVHDEGLLHCDVKPENALVEESSQRVRLLDFGVAMAAPTGRVLPRGTLPFMAPEWIQGATPDARVDLYALGMLLFCVTTGGFPFTGDRRDEIIRFHLEGNVRFPAGLAGVPAWWGSIIERLLAKEPADRFPSVEALVREMCLRSGRDVALHTRETWEERFRGGRWVGRADAAESVRSAVEKAREAEREDRPVLLRLHGPAGVGKSRLLLELKRGYQLRGDAVVLESGGAADPVTALAQSLCYVLGDDHPAWQAYGTALLDIGPSDETGGEADVDARTRRVEELGELLLAAAADAPLIVLMDDAQALDAVAVRAFSYVVHAVDYELTRPDQSGAPPRVVLVAALDDDATSSSFVGFDEHRLVVDVDLPPLDRDAVPRFLSTVLGERSVPDSLQEEVAAASGGNPAFILALLSFFAERGALRREPSGLVFDRAAVGEETVPGSLEDSLRNLVADLDESDRHVLSFLALAAHPYPTEVLARASRLATEELAATLARLVNRGLVESDPSRPGAPLRPASQTLASVVGGLLPEKARRDVHGALLDALRQAAPEVATPDALACHLWGAGQWEEGARAALLAAQEARRRGAFDIALTWLSRAETMAGDDAVRMREVSAERALIRTLQGRFAEAATEIESALASGDDLSPEERAAWILRLGDVRLREGAHEAAEEALAELTEKSEAETAGDRAAAVALRARVAFFRGDHARAGAEANEAVATLGSVATEAGKRWLGHAHCTRGLAEVYGGDPEVARHHLQAARPLLAAADDRRELAFLANAFGLLHHRTGDTAAALTAYRESLGLAREIGDQRRETIARMNLSVLHQNKGQYREAIAEYLESLERAYRVQDRESLMRIGNNLGNIYRFLGRLDEAAQWVARSLTEAEQRDATLLRGYNQLILGEVQLFRGEPEAAQRRFGEAERLLRETAHKEAWLEARLDQAAWQRIHGDPREAVMILKEVLAEATDEKLDDHKARALLETALVGLDKGSDEEDIAAALRLLLEALVIVESSDLPELAWRVHGGLVRAYVALGRVPEARHHMERTAAARARLEEQIPSDLRTQFFERADRRKLQDDVDAAAKALQDLAATGEALPADLLPAGTSLVRLLEINKQLNSEHRLDRLLNHIMDATIQLTGAERGFILLRKEGRLQIEVARNIDQETIRKSKLKISHSIAEQVLETGRPVVAHDAMDDERYRDYVSIHALKLRSVVCIPLNDRDSTFGAVYLDNRFQAHAFSEEHLSLLEAFAEQAAVAITNARLHERNVAIMEELEKSRDQVERLNKELEKKLVAQTALLEQTQAALSRRQTQLEDRFSYGQLIGRSAGIQKVYELIDRVKDVDIPVVIHGDSGTGKELVARAIHFSGARRKNDFVSVNCAAFPETLLESELFGHKRGAFTGADRDKPGLFQVAHRGTLFLDEVGDMSLGMQAKLLRALQEHEIRPVGGNESMRVDVRVIAASNQDIKALIEAGKFREDLYYRLNVVTIRVPPLRERREDIPLLVEHFLERIVERDQTAPKRVTADALKILTNYDWPGNVRELESTITTAALFAAGDEIGAADLGNKPELIERNVRRPMQDLADRSLAELEKEAIIQALIRHGGNKVAASKALGISRRSLYNKLNQYDIQLSQKTTVVR